VYQYHLSKPLAEPEILFVILILWMSFFNIVHAN